uniref:HEAT repeat-containing protein 5B-like n=1 Tax=Phallusia mammillata TaxID=59560 RepID=A0A6F9DDQ7_9ASCI|nr:HEAT repeat-containing protein 5B-like [Phallusia mammillata]
MMELAHGLLLNEEALKTVAENKRDIFIYEWLRFLLKVLKASQKSDIKEKQGKLVLQLNAQIAAGPGPPTRTLIGQCLSALYKVGDSFTIYETVNKCNDIVRNKDDSPSFLSIRLSAIVCAGVLYENNGRMLGGLFPESVQVFVKGLRNAESQTRSETMIALKSLMIGLGASATMCHRDIYKAAKVALIDRSMAVRTSAAQCLEELVKESSFVYTNEFESLIQQCVRSLDGSTYETRCAVARLLGTLVAGTQRAKPAVTKGRKPSLDEALTALANGFLNAGSSGGARDLLKGSSTVSVRNIRIGITEAYVEFVRELGTEWLERHLAVFLNKVLDIVAQPKATSTHVEAVYSRRCVSFILQSTLGAILGESQQQAAIRQLCQIVTKHMATVDTFNNEGNNPNSSTTAEIFQIQHVLVCALLEIGSLMRSLGTSALPLITDTQNSVVDCVLSVLLFPSHSARLSAAWCLRCISVAIPSQLTSLIDKCIEKLQRLRSSGDAVAGYSAALAALFGAVQECPMGIPQAKGKVVFTIAEEILRSVSQNSHLSIYRTQGAWLLIGSVMTLGPSTVKHLLPKLLLLWRTSFPRSMKELEQEKQRGDSFTWQLTLESRSGALCAMRSFVAHCGELLTEEITRKLMVPLESAMAMMAMLPHIISMHGPHLKASAAMVRLRLYDILGLLPPSSYEGSFSALLRELVAEFTLTDNPANTTTSLLHSLCHQDDSVLLGSWLRDTDQSLIEDQLQGHSASGSGSLEHDPTCIYLQCPLDKSAPGPLPLGVSVIDAAIALFGIAFPHVAMKHRLQMLKHFDDCAKQAEKNQQRHRAIQMNVFTALICALKGLGENKRRLGGEDIRNAATQLIISALASTDVTLRCAAGEAVGRMAQVTNDAGFVAKTAQICFDKLKTARDVISRTGHSLALGCLHRYVGGMGSGQHLRTSVGILLALSQDNNSPEVQVWSLHALSLIIDAFGPMFRSYVDATLQVVLTLFLQVAPHHFQVHRCLGKCLGALITTLGPELQVTTSSISSARSSCLTCCAIMSHHTDAQVQAESISCLQQLHLFAPRHVELSTLVPRLGRCLSSWHLILRRASVSCLRQLSQKEAADVCEIAAKSATKHDVCDVKRGVMIGETGLEGALFFLLDREIDPELTSDVRDSLSHILQHLALDNIGFWLSLCKSTLAASSDRVALNTIEHQQQETGDDETNKTNDDDTFTTNKDGKGKNVITPRWTTRVFAVELVRRIIAMCRQSDSNPAHFDLAAARNIVRGGKNGDFLVLHLSDLVRMTFMAATDNSAQLRMAGLEALQDVIKYFKDVPEPEFHGSVILEQYQANVGAALRPAFSDNSHDVTVRACEVCSAWIASGVVSDLSDLKRVHALLVSSLAKVNQNDSASKPIYSESASTMEKLAVLKAWSEVYIVAVENEKNKPPGGEESTSADGSLLTLVEPHLKLLADYWQKALKDQAILKLPQEFHVHLPAQGGAFFTMESASSVTSHYSYAWPNILHALSLWMANVDFAEEQEENEKSEREEKRERNLHLVMGVCVEALCSPRISDSVGVITACLSSLNALFSAKWTRQNVGKNQVFGIEVLNVLHRLLLTRDSFSTQKLVVEVVKKIVLAAKEHLFKDGDFTEVQAEGEGGESGSIEAGKSTVFAVLEICMCVLVRQIPTINPTFRNKTRDSILTNKKLPQEAADLVATSIALLNDVLCLCSPRGSLTILPTVLYLLVGALREGTSLDADATSQRSSVVVASSALHAFRSILTSPFLKMEVYQNEWKALLRSSLSSILDFAKDHSKTDVSSILTCQSLFLLTAPPSVCQHPKLLVAMLDYFEKAFESDNAKDKLKCATFLTPIFKLSNHAISRPFVHRMAPLLTAQLAQANHVVTSDDAAVVIECLNLLEMLVDLTEDVHRDEMVQALVPLFVSCLNVDSDRRDANGNLSLINKVHESALQRLLQIGPKYPVPFKVTMQNDPVLKQTLEGALRNNQAKIHQEQQRATSAQNVVRKAAAPPTIKLKQFGKK